MTSSDTSIAAVPACRPGYDRRSLISPLDPPTQLRSAKGAPAPMGAARACSTHSLGAVLERDRLERRVGRLTIAIAVLRHRMSEDRRNPGAPPRHVRQAIADFEAQIDAMDSRLRDLAPDGTYVSLARDDRLSKGKAQ
jgi:hypothetical protein